MYKNSYFIQMKKARCSCHPHHKKNFAYIKFQTFETIELISKNINPHKYYGGFTYLKLFSFRLETPIYYPAPQYIKWFSDF